MFFSDSGQRVFASVATVRILIDLIFVYVFWQWSKSIDVCGHCQDINLFVLSCIFFWQWSKSVDICGHCQDMHHLVLNLAIWYKDGEILYWEIFERSQAEKKAQTSVCSLPKSKSNLAGDICLFKVKRVVYPRINYWGS